MSDEHEIPGHLTAATRLGAAHELGQSLIVSIFDGRRHLYLAERRGSVRYPKPVWVDPPGAFDIGLYEHRADNPLAQGLAARRNDTRFGRVRLLPCEQRRERERWVVVEYLGSEPEGHRSLALSSADALGVPILDWPGERLWYVVEYPGHPLRGVQIVGADDVDDSGQQSFS